MKKQLLSPLHCAYRLRWSMERCHWRERQWARVIFSDESMFYLFRHDGRIRVWRSRFEPPEMHLLQIPTFCQKVHVWAAISVFGPTELVFLDKVNGAVYVEILESHLLPYATHWFGSTQDFLYQDDNATPHRCRIVNDYKMQSGIRTLKWPSRSPDVNPIENIWGIIKYRVAMQQPQTVLQLKELLVAEWRKISPELCRKLIINMPRRIQSMLTRRGLHIKY